jgi:uridine kinase
VDGPAGSGKTTLATALDRAFRDALRASGGDVEVATVHMDDVYDGWAGLASGMATIASSVVAPLRAGKPGRYRRYDWHRAAFADERVVDPCDVVIVEGVGAAGTDREGYDDAITVLVWVETPSEVRLSRGLARDGEQMRAHWVAWRTQEEAMFAREHTRDRADVVVDGA